MSKTLEQLAKKYAEDFCDRTEFEALQDAFFAGYNAAQPKWISVKEKTPEVNQWCAWCDATGVTEPCTAFRDINDFEFWWENYTHWMPLPAPPKEEV